MAVEYYDSFIQKDTAYILALNKRAEELRYQNSDSIRFYAEKALRLSEAADYEKGIIYASSNLALHELYQGNTEAAIRLNQKITTNSALNKYPDLAIKIYNDLAQSYFIRTEYSLSYRNFLLAQDLAVKSNNQEEVVRINSNLGTMFSLLEDYEEGLKYYQEALKYISKEGKDHITGVILANLGYVNLKMGNYDDALKYLNEALDLVSDSNFSTIRGFTLLNLGEVYAKKTELDTALSFYKQAKEDYDTNNDKKGTADLYYGLSSAYLELGDYDTSLAYAEKSLELYTSFKLKTGMEHCYRNLYKIYKNKNELNFSLHYLELAEKYAYSISKIQNKTNILMSKAKMDFDAEKAKIERADRQTIDQQKRYIRWSTASLVVALTVVLIIYQSNKKKKELNKTLAEKTKVLSENEKILNETNTTKDKLFSIIGHDLRGPIVSLRELVALSLEDKASGESYYKKFAPILNRKLDHLQFTLDNLLNWGQTQMSGASVTPEVIFVKREIDDIITLLTEKFNEKSIKISNKINPDHQVYVDKNHFAVIFRNLLSNALKFTLEEGEVIILTKKTINSLIISVKDNGLGMDKITLDKVWNNQEHHSTYGTKMEKGTGLGLSLCKEMVEKNKGKITIESEPGKGSTFFVELPLPKTID
jgi:signal transduction histidine kinase